MDNVRKLAMVAGFIPQLGVRGQRRTWKNSQSAAKFQMVEQATLLGAGGGGGVASTMGRVAGSSVWYQYTNSTAGVDGYKRQIRKRALNNMFRNLTGVVTPSAVFAASGDTTGILTSTKSKEDKYLKDAFTTYRKQVSTYSKTLLSEINNTAGLGKRDYGVKDIEPNRSAMMPAEQTTVVSDSIEGVEDMTKELNKPIGLTQGTDVIYKIGDKILHIEETEMLISQGGHHGINTRIRTKEEIQGYLKQGKEGEKKIQKIVKDYFNNEITKNWNPAIRNIKSIAKEVYGTKTPTPEQMRMPAMEPTEIKGRGGAKKYAESTSKAQMQRLLKPLVEEGSKQNTNSTIEHINHFIGTFNSHAGNVYHGLTVSHKPHRTIAVPLSMYGARAAKAYEFKKVQKVAFYRGFASLGIIRENLKGTQFVTDSVQDKMKSAHLGIRLGVNGGAIQVNTVAGVNASLGAKPKSGFAYYIPGENKTRTKLLEDYASKLLDDMATGVQGPEQKAPAMAVGSRFQNVMNNLEKTAIRQNLSPDREYTFWASPFYGIGIQN